MGRFYESTGSTFIDDKMFKAPSELMALALQNKDKQIDTQIESVEAFDPLLNIKGLDADTPRGREIIKQYHDKMNDIVNGISKNPLEYNNYSRQIRELGRNIKSDFSQGEAYNINNNKILYDKEIAKIDALDPKLHEAGYKEKEKARILAKYQEGLKWDNAQGKAGNSLQIQDAYHGLAVNDDEFRKYMEANGYTTEKDRNGGDGYRYTKGRGGEYLTEKDLIKAKYDYMKADPALQEAVKRRGDIGQDDFIGADLDNALTYDKNGNPILSNDFFGKQLETAKRFAYNKSTKKDTIEEDGWYQTQFGYARADAEKKADIMASPVVEAKIRTQAQYDALNKTYYNLLNQTAIDSGLPKLPNGQTYKNYTQISNKIKSIRRTANAQTDPNKKKIALAKVTQLENKLKITHDSYRGNVTEAGWSSFGTFYGTKTAIAAQKQMDKYVNTDWRTIADKKMQFTYQTKGGKTISRNGITFYDIYSKPEEYGLDKNVFAERDDEGDIVYDNKTKKIAKKKPLKDFFVQNSGIPMMVSDKEWGLNDMMFNFESEGTGITGKISFNKLGIKQAE